MKFLKYFFLSLLGVIVLLLIVGAFVKKEYSVEKNVIINKPTDEVFGYVKYLRNQESYSVWEKLDPNMKHTYRGTDGMPGFVSAWESEVDEAGVGEQEITAINDNRIEYELRFIKPFKATNHSYMITEKQGDSTTNVKWGFQGKMAYPLNLMLLFTDFDSMVGKDLQGGLDNLKSILESKS